ncbi:tetratricopeptide repeat protein [Pedobacter metabolipauper]|uniref:TPR repeat protein n=1 Tax=Pedobacter metabolipauper TaxID=425513 RepID=A0A4R6SWA0_9SPHI|nr:SEL1-like repeat protein [Pedobacter metabolipauper]TDQ08402.1 TPR repeat protein [Pedobacter metabolipauper]
MSNKSIRFYAVIFTVLSEFAGFHSFAQRKDIAVAQIDQRFTVSIQKNWGVGFEEYFFTITNNTNDAYRLVMTVDLDLACVGKKKLTIGLNKFVYLPPNGKFTPEKDNDYTYNSGSDNFKDCRLKDGNSYTLLKELKYEFSDIRLATAAKTEPEKTKAEPARTNTASGTSAKVPEQTVTKSEKEPTPTIVKSNTSTSTSQNNGNSTRSNASFTAEVNQNLKKQNDKFWSDIAESDRKTETQSANLMTSYYAAKAVQNAKTGLNNLTELSGNYSSVQELEAEFRAKSSAINEQVQELTEARNNNLQAAKEVLFTGSGASENALGQAIVGFGAIFNSIKADKEAKEARDELRRARAAERTKLEEQKKALTQELRMNFLDQFPDGGIPQTSAESGIKELYFFSYILDRRSIGENEPTVFVTNVFPLARYKGKWPSKSTISGDISALKPGEVTLMGYYSTKEQAEQMQGSFVNLAAKTGFRISTIRYAGREANGNDYLSDDEKKGAAVELAKNSTDAFKDGLKYFVDKDFISAYEFFKKAAKEGDAEAMQYIGDMHYAGSIGTRSFDQAFAWYKMAADNGNVESMVSIGGQYLHGNGVATNLPEALNWYKKGALKGHAISMYLLGKCYYNAWGTTQNVKAAREWFLKASANGCNEGAYYLGLIYFNGWDTPENNLEALRWFKVASPANGIAAEYAADMYYNGWGVKEDRTQAIELYKKAAALGEKAAARKIGEIYYSEPEANPAEALKWFKKAADDGDILGNQYMGEFNYFGIGKKKDLPEAAQWFKRITFESADAMYYLGLINLEGETGTPDNKEAMNWFLKAAEKGHASATFYIGSMYHEGLAGPKSVTKALNWYKKSASMGDVNGQLNLAEFYFYGAGVPRNYTEAIAWYTKAAEQGHEHAMLKLSEMYETGTGTTKNPVLAKKWLDKTHANKK